MGFSKDVIDAVWNRCAGKENNGYKMDQCTAWIYKDSYGKQSSYGWQIDHITPISKGGTDELSNLRALHWANNLARSNGRLNTTKPEVKSVGTVNHRLDDNGNYKKI